MLRDEFLSEIARSLEAWFARQQRPLPWRSEYDPWSVWVSEIMLQQTRMEVVLRYFLPFVDRFPAPADLARADVDEVLTAWSGLGYYRRARMLHAGATYVTRQLQGVIPSAVEELVRIPGVGRYTAGAIASIAFNVSAPVADGNIERVAARLLAIEASARSGALNRQAWIFAGELVAASASPRMLNQALMELGATVCTPRRPRCANCPLRAHCRAAALDPERFPAAATRRPPVDLSIPLLFVRGEGGAVLMRKERGGLMTGMVHLPHGDGALLTSSADHFSKGALLGSFRHTITHRRIRFEVYAAEPSRQSLSAGPDEYCWVPPDDLSEWPHPSYVRKALRIALDACRGVA
jgi:A/G-specific adenine glycosylase